MKKTADFFWVLNKTKEKWKNQCFLLLVLLLVQPLAVFTLQPISSHNTTWVDGVVVTQSNYEGLQAFKNDLIDPSGILRSWNDSGIGACSGRWIGIKCAQGEVIVIQLPWKGLGGRISEKIGQLTALRKLNLHDNFIVGMIPSSLGFLPNLRGLHLFNNQLSGSIPPSIGLCPLLQTLDLSHNSLTGTIPPTLSSNSTKLYRLNLSFNALTGSIPTTLTQSPSLIFLALHYNNLSGSIPDTWGGVGGGGVGGSGTTTTTTTTTHDLLLLYRLQSLTLDHNFFSGNLPSSLSNLGKLQEISLSHNQINGTIPIEIGNLRRLQTLDLSNNAIAGSFPPSLCNLSSLIQLNLQGNNLDNQIPESIDGLQKLSVLDLSRNQFKGHIPASLGNITSLTRLDLSHNRLTGDIPDSLVDLLPNLSSFNVSFNSLSGSVPSPLTTQFNSSSFVGNLQLCGYSVSNPCPSFPPQSLPALSPGDISEKTGRHRSGKLSTKDIILIASGALLGVLLLLCGILFCCLIRKKAASKAKNNGHHRSVATAAVAGGGGEKGAPATETEAGGETGGKLIHFDGPLMFNADDLLCATAEIMGKSTYGTAYKATLEDGSQVAVKRLREKIAKSQKEFEGEVNAIGKIRHPNLLALRAYYLGPKGEKLLVFDFMPRGSLAAFLHARGPDTPIDWPTRMNIAIGTASGLCYLHTQENIVHGNLTAGNILLDEQTSAKIADYGLSRLMTNTANSNAIATAASLGYRAPELSKVKKVSTKTDVYSLGVIILELLTGKSPGEAMNGIDLPQWVASIVNEEWTNEVFDLELMKDANSGDELLNTLKLALHCVDPSPAARPEVQQVLQQLEEIIRPMPLSSGDDVPPP